MSMPINAAALLLLTVAGLGGCQASESAPAPSPSGLSGLSESISAEIREEMATEDLDLDNDDGKLPKATLSPAGDLVVDGKTVAMDESQRAAALDYRRQLAGVAEAGALVGLQGAALAKVALKEAAKGLFSGDEKAMETRIEAEAEGVKKAALALCGQLPALLASEARFAKAVPEFAPYARMTQADVEECEVDI